MAHLSGWPRSHSYKADPQELLLNYRYIVNLTDKQQHSFILGIWHRKWLLNYFLRWALLATLYLPSIRRSGARFAVSWGALSPGDLHRPPLPSPLSLCFPLPLPLLLPFLCCLRFVSWFFIYASLHTHLLFVLPLLPFSSTSATFHSPPLMPILTVNRVLPLRIPRWLMMTEA